MFDHIIARLTFAPHSHGRMARCPAHQDRRASLSVKIQDDRLLLYCFAGCRIEEICAALGVAARDLYAPRDDQQRARPAAPRAIEVDPLATARDELVARERQHQQRRDQYREQNADADAIRILAQTARRARAVATILGDCPEAWDLLSGAAELERLALASEADLDRA